jgi:hypothetical protein
MTADASDSFRTLTRAAGNTNVKSEDPDDRYRGEAVPREAIAR